MLLIKILININKPRYFLIIFLVCYCVIVVVVVVLLISELHKQIPIIENSKSKTINNKKSNKKSKQLLNAFSMIT